MRAMILSLLSFGLFLPGASVLRAQDDLRSVIDKAIKAHGGEARIDKRRISQTKTKGTLHLGGGNRIEFTEEITLHLPNKFKSSSQFEFMGTHKVMIGFDGTKAWMNEDGQNKDMMLDKLTDLMKEQAYVSEVTLLTTLKDSAYELSGSGETKVLDKPAVGVRVAREGHKDINLYFDKDSGLLIKFDHRTMDLKTMQEVNVERIITEYQDKDGLKEPKKGVVNRDGKKFIEAEVVEVKYLDGIDDTQFSKP
jgi:hypothetical protein